MGALTSNRKRGEDYFTLHSLSDFDSHASKKPRLSSSSSSTIIHHLSPVPSRLSRYPDPIHRLPRQVHAPCRVSRFGFSSGSRPILPGGSAARNEPPADPMGSALASRYETARSTAIRALRYFKKDKEVAIRDDDDGDVSVGSSIEEIEVLGSGGPAGLSVVLDQSQRSLETSGVLARFRELDRKAEEGNFQPSSSSVVSDLTNSSLKGEAALTNRELDVSGVPLHKKLLQSAERRNSVLSNLSFQIQLAEKFRATLQLFRPPKKPEEDVPREPFVPLSKDEEAEVSRALSISQRRRVLVAHENSNIEITGEVLQCLRPGAWLNDEVINLYLELLKERERREPKKFLKCHFCNTFFYKKLIGGRGGYDFKSVRRWTTQRKLGYFLLECDKIFVPIHKDIHWCLAVINKKEEKFQYLDSLGGIDNQVLKVLARYFVDEVKDKSGKDIDVSSWKQEFVKDLPEQGNGYDCGVFMIKYADFYSRGVGLCFNQGHMPYFRLRTAKEILSLKAE